MNNIVDLSKPIAGTIREHPEVKEILIDLGFKPLSKPAILDIVGEVTSLRAGAKLANILLEEIQRTLESNGYEVIGGSYD